MQSWKHRLIGAGFATLASTGIDRLLAPLTRGRGAILTFHRVCSPVDQDFAPNRLLEIAPAFLDALIGHLRRRGYDVVPIDEVTDRLKGAARARFVALTFDDGFRDNFTEALPVLERHAAPFTVFVTTGFADRTARLWWVELEEVLRSTDRIEVDIDGLPRAFPCRTPDEKQQAFRMIARRLMNGPNAARTALMAALCDAHGVSGEALVEALCMRWDEIARLAAHPLATIGAHTITHPNLARLDASGLLDELESSRRMIEANIGRPVRHLAYPYGHAGAAGPREFAAAREAGYAGAVTTRPGVLVSEYANHPMALPRLSVNGLWPDLRMVDVMLSGVPFVLWNRGRRVNVA